MSCEETKEILTDLALGEADPAERELAREHLEACEACRAQLADLNLARKLLVEGLPQEEVPRRIAFVAAETGRVRWLWRRAVAIPLGVAAAVALLVGTLALARTRIVLERGRWEIAFGVREAGRTAGPESPVPPSQRVSVPSLTREDAARLVAAAVGESEARQRGETAALVKTATLRQNRRYLRAMVALGEQMRYFQSSQTTFSKEADRTRLALEMVASRLPAAKGEQQ